MNSKTLWIALGVGAAAGTIAALLYAPSTGPKLRRALSEAYEEAGEYLADAGDFLKDRTERLSREAQSSYEAGAEEATKVYGDLAGAVSSAIDNAGKTLAASAPTLGSKTRSML